MQKEAPSSSRFIVFLAVFALFASPTFAENCPAISSPGIYAQTQDYVGAPNAMSGGHACVRISASNVLFNCAGHSMADNGTSSSYGIFVEGTNIRNVTITGCTVYNYSQAGLQLDSAENCSISSLYAGGNGYGVRIEGGRNNSMVNSYAMNSNNTGIYLYDSDLASMSNVYAQYNGYYGIMAISVDGIRLHRVFSIFNNETGVYVLGSGNLSGSQVGYNEGSGVYVSSLDFNAYGNYFYNNGEDGFELSGASQNTNIFDNVAFENSGAGFVIGRFFPGMDAVSIKVYNNTVANNTGPGIHFSNSRYSSVYNNTVYGCGGDGIYIGSTRMQNNFTNNRVYNNTGHGFHLNYSNYSMISGSEVYNNTVSGLYFAYSYYNAVNQTKSYTNGQYGFHLSYSTGNTLDMCNASKNGGGIKDGFHLASSHGTNMTNSYATQSNNGFYLINSNSNRMQGCNSSANNVGFSLVGSSSTNSIYDCTASGNDINGFAIAGSGASKANSIQGSLASQNEQYGFAIASDSNGISNSVSSENRRDGFLITGINNTLLNNTANGQARGVYVSGNNTLDRNSHYYNNTIAYYVIPDASGFFINVTNISIDSPSGEYADYTSLSFTDIAQAGESYSIKWAGISSLPQGRSSFHGKLVNISSLAGTPSIDSITWSWAASELTGNFPELWKYNNSGWELIGSSMDSSARSITLTSMNPASEYGIMQTGCPVITSGGSYRLGADAVGAPNDASPVAQYACVKIAASNVVFDCGGHTITDNGTRLTWVSRGILLNGSLTNVTVKNCPGVSNYTYGFSVHQSNSCLLQNNTAYDNQVGFHTYQSSYNVFNSNTARDQSSQGFYFDQSSNNNLTGNSANGNENNGFLFRTSSNSNRLSGNTANNNGVSGFLAFQDSLYNTFTGNNASSNGWHGFFMYNTSDCNLTNNYASSNVQCAVHINSSSAISVSGMVISNQSCWIGPEDGAPLEIINLTAQSGTTRVVFGSVDYTGDGLDESNFVIGDGFIALDSAARPEFNTSATITMPIDSCRNPRIYKTESFPVIRYDILGEGRRCTDCTIISCTGNMITFTVPHWSGYAVGGETSLAIDNDGPKYMNDTITFTANYSNTTAGAGISGADCILSLWNGSSYTMPESGGLYVLPLNIMELGTHSYNVTCNKTGYETLTAFDTFTIFFNVTPSSIDLYAANVTVGSTGRYDPNITAGNVTTEGGNVTNVDLNSNASTDRWAGFYGNITGAILLSQRVGAQAVYIWAWDSSYGGVVCASTGSSAPSELMGATYADIDDAWSFSPTVTDSAARTFNNSNCSQTFGPTTLANSYYADTGSAGGFITCAWKSVFTPAKSNMLFCTNITNSGPLFNGETGDYEIMVPTAYGTGVYETYYFYASLN